MTHPSKNKGNGYERELVNQAKKAGLKAKRAYASNGQSLGMHEEVDCLIAGQRIQAKRRKKLLKGIQDMIGLLEHTDAVVFREDKCESFVLVRWSDWLDLHSSLEKIDWTETYERDTNF
jgi:hypothetical protein